MLRNYLFTASRALLRYKSFSVINVTGLAVGMAAFLLIVQYIRYELTYDAFHEKGERIYRVGTNFYREGIPAQYAATFLGLGPAMKADFPEVAAFTRLSFRRSIVSYQNQAFTEENLFFADADLLNIFTLQMQQGSNAPGLQAPNEILLSQSAAKKYFGKEQAVGKVLTLKTRLLEQDVTVKGVFADLPSNSHVPIDFLVSIQTLASHIGNERLNGWDSIDHFTYILLAPGTDVPNLRAKLPAFIDKYLGKVWNEGPGLGIGQNRTELVLQPLLDIHLHSDLQNEAEANGNIATVRLLMLVAFFILLLACINYVNLSTARALERAKEVAVRKVIGASRKQLSSQFFFEALLLNFAALLLAFTLVQLAGPWLNKVAAKPFYVFKWLDTGLWLSLSGVFLAGSFLSGMYPAYLLSSFKPVLALKGKMHQSFSIFSFRRILIMLQFVVAVLMVAGTYTVYRQMQFMQTSDLGMNIDQLLVVKAPSLKVADSVAGNKAAVFKQELLSQAAIATVTVFSSVPNAGMYGTIGAVGRVGTVPAEVGHMFHHVQADIDFMRTYAMKLLAGRNFTKDLSTEKNSLILSEAAIKVLGFQSPAEAVNQRILYEGEKTIIGVIKDFHQYSLAKEVIPIILELSATNAKYFSAKITPHLLPQTIASIEQTYKKLYPDSPFEYFFMDEHFAKQYEADKRFGYIFSLFSGMAIFIACLGLFGLVSYASIQRNKEIGVRKVLGASVSSILLLLAKDFMKLVLWANLIAWPIIYWSIYTWLSGYAYHTPIHAGFFIIPSLAVVLIAFLTIFYQTLKSAKENPVKALRDE
ncbi:ABC transporter permease [Rhodocytophaga aerolata]|uniref:ABC transporter permease n=1 Tax=Rhodocytophaga aerolata TaxID=455078 RepID=A0ABT8R5J6_9BACT|nr:ABC transporter permease [Rhodocytophaga aerolata]MDO1447199.1 ABC transporter permease [Rhodocytophaga aerolata]